MVLLQDWLGHHIGSSLRLQSKLFRQLVFPWVKMSGTSIRERLHGLRHTRCFFCNQQEEDFVTMAYGLPIEGEGDSKCLAFLNTVEEVVARQLRGCKGGPTTKKKSFEGRNT